MDSGYTSRADKFCTQAHQQQQQAVTVVIAPCDEASELPMQQQQHSFLAYLASSGLDTVARSSLLPFTVLLLRQSVGSMSSKDDSSWSIVMCAYGLLASLLELGQVCGRHTKTSAHTEGTGAPPGHLLALAICFLAMTLSSRYSTLCVIYFVVGYCCAVINNNQKLDASALEVFYRSDVTVSGYDSGSRQHRSASRADKAFEEEIGLRIAIFVVTVLVSAMLYDHTELSLFPARDSCRLVAFLSFVLFIVFQRPHEIKRTARDNACSAWLQRLVGRRGSGRLSTSTLVPQRAVPPAAAMRSDEPQHAGAVPKNFLATYKSESRAAEAYAKMLIWRKDNNIDSILASPQPNFDSILELYPHFIHGRSRDGCCVLYEVLGSAKPAELARLKVTPASMVRHFVLRNEMLFSRHDSGTDGFVKLMTVLDVKDIRVTDITTDVISFIRQSSEVMDAYYPCRVRRLVICNAPYWFYSVWGMVARVLPDRARAKISIIHDTAGLDEFIDASQRPPAYGGTSTPLGTCPEHLAFVALKGQWGLVEEFSSYRDSSSRDSDSDGDWVAPAPPATKPSPAPQTAAAASWWGQRQQPTTAYLGERNSYRYDEESSSWLMDVAADSDEQSRRPASSELSAVQLEEHGLVLAIQAAHLARDALHSNGNHADDGPAVTANKLYGGGSSGDVSRGSISERSAERRGGDSAYSQHMRLLGGRVGHRGSDGGSKMSSQIFLLVMSMFVTTSLIQVGVVTLLPVWLAADVVQGGLGFNAADTAITLACAGLMALFAISRLAPLLADVRASPLQVLRYCCAAATVLGLLTPLLLHRPSMADVHAAPDAMHMAHLISIRTRRRPFMTLLASLLLSSLLATLYFARQTASILLQVALTPIFTSPLTVLGAVGALCDVIGPLLLSVIFSGTFKHHLHYPMDAAFFFSLATCLSPLVLIGAVLLEAKFRGDFGVISDNSSAALGVPALLGPCFRAAWRSSRRADVKVY